MRPRMATAAESPARKWNVFPKDVPRGRRKDFVYDTY